MTVLRYHRPFLRHQMAGGFGTPDAAPGERAAQADAAQASCREADTTIEVLSLEVRALEAELEAESKLRGQQVEKCEHERAVQRDLVATERTSLEERVSRGQRLEAVGQLAAGIAHEINTPVQYVGDNLRFVRDALGALVPLLQRLSEWRDRLTAEPDGAPGAHDASQGSQGTTSALRVSADVASEICAALEAADLPFLLAELPTSVAHALDGIVRIGEIVRAVGAIAHPGSGSKSLVDLNAVLETVITVSRAEWRYVADVSTDFAPDLPPIVCHAGAMHQVFLNLVVNAAQAIAEVPVSEGAVAPVAGRISVRTRCVGDMVEVRIEDTGAGIPPSIGERVFEPFFTTKEVGRGTGQGLALAFKVVTGHGGRISFESEPGAGTTFVVTLPVVEASLLDGTACDVGARAA